MRNSIAGIAKLLAGIGASILYATKLTADIINPPWMDNKTIQDRQQPFAVCGR
jgi:hypothetical protein